MVTLIGSDEKEKEKLMFENTRGTLSAVRYFLIKLRGVSSIVPEEKRERRLKRFKKKKKITNPRIIEDSKTEVEKVITLAPNKIQSEKPMVVLKVMIVVGEAFLGHPAEIVLRG